MEGAKGTRLEGQGAGGGAGEELLKEIAIKELWPSIYCFVKQSLTGFLIVRLFRASNILTYFDSP